MIKPWVAVFHTGRGLITDLLWAGCYHLAWTRSTIVCIAQAFVPRDSLQTPRFLRSWPEVSLISRSHGLSHSWFASDGLGSISVACMGGYVWKPWVVVREHRFGSAVVFCSRGGGALPPVKCSPWHHRCRAQLWPARGPSAPPSRSASWLWRSQPRVWPSRPRATDRFAAWPARGRCDPVLHQVV